MKKKLLITLLCGMMVFSLCACGGGDSADGNNSNDSVNVGTTNESDDGKADKENKKEKAIKKSSESITYANGEEQNYSYYEYDEKGREVLYKNRNAASGQENTITTTWEEDGNTEIGTTSVGGTKTDKYDADGNLLSSEVVQYGKVVVVTTYTYENGVLTESYQENTSMPSMKMVTEIKYDEHGNYTYYKMSYNDEVKSIVEQSFTYNENGDVETVTTKTTGYTIKGEQTTEYTSEYVYENGILTGITSDTGSVEIKCDENGNILEQITYDANGNIISKNTVTYY